MPPVSHYDVIMSPKVTGASGRLCIRGSEVEAFDGLREVAHEVGAAEFAVREDFEANFFLTLKDSDDVASSISCSSAGDFPELRASRSSRGRG